MNCPNCKTAAYMHRINHGYRCGGCGGIEAIDTGRSADPDPDWAEERLTRTTAKVLARETQLVGAKAPAAWESERVLHLQGCPYRQTPTLICMCGVKAEPSFYVGPPGARIKIKSDATMAPGTMRFESSPDGVNWHEAAVTADPTVPPHMAYVLEAVPVGLLVERDRLRREAGEVMGIKFLAPQPPPNPLDAVIDGVTLRELLEIDEERRREAPPSYRTVWSQLSPVQRAAVSTHWSAELRARVEATAKPKLTVMVDCDE